MFPGAAVGAGAALTLRVGVGLGAGAGSDVGVGGTEVGSVGMRVGVGGTGTGDCRAVSNRTILIITVWLEVMLISAVFPAIPYTGPTHSSTNHPSFGNTLMVTVRPRRYRPPGIGLGLRTISAASRGFDLTSNSRVIDVRVGVGVDVGVGGGVNVGRLVHATTPNNTAPSIHLTVNIAKIIANCDGWMHPPR